MASNKEASRRYALAHPERRRTSSAKWRAKNRKRHSEASKAWRAKNPERNKQNTRAWREKNKEKWNASKRVWWEKNAVRINKAAAARRAANHAVYLEKERRYKAANADRIFIRVRQTRLKKNYGLSLEEYAALLAAQGGVCAICSREPEGRNFPVDHDHRTNMVRGILCHPCNLGLGSFKESDHLLLSAIRYLKNGAAR